MNSTLEEIGLRRDSNEVLSDFKNRFKAIIDEWKHDVAEDDTEYYKMGVRYCEELMDAGKELQLNLSEEGEIVGRYFIYECMKDWRDFAIYCRNLNHNYYKAILLLNDPNSDKLNSFYKKASTDIGAISGELLGQLDAGHPNEDFLEVVKDQVSPWLSYELQLEEIKGQIKWIFTSYRKMLDSSLSFDRLKDKFNQVLDKYDSTQASQIGSLEESLSLMVEDPFDSNSVIRRMEKWLEGRRSIDVAEYSMGSGIFNSLKLHEVISVPITMSNGALYDKEIELSKELKSWVEKVLFPLVYESREIVLRSDEKVNRIIINLKNQLKAVRDEMGNIDFNVRQRMIFKLEEELKDLILEKESIYTINQKVIYLLESRLKVVNLYDPKVRFLENEKIKNTQFDEVSALRRVEEFGKKIKNTVYSLGSRYDDYQFDQKRSLSERIIHAVETRQFNESSNYAQVFLARAYDGEFFWVNRKKEENEVMQLVHLWSSGYRGTLLLEGNRFCGKSVFAKQISNRYFKKITLSLSPNTTIKIGGRKVELSDNLEEVLQDIERYTVNQTYMILIDDLEKWCNAKMSMSKVARTLGKFIDDNATKNFIIVTMSCWVKDQLNKLMKFDSFFTKVLNLNEASAAEITEMIKVRHGATQTEMIQENGELIGAEKLIRLKREAIYRGEKNIGDTLGSWVAMCKEINDDTVQLIKKYEADLPDFLEDDFIPILNLLYSYRCSDEYSMRKTFGPAFGDKYKNVLRRLIALGVVVRNKNTKIEINRLIVNDLERLLINKI